MPDLMVETPEGVRLRQPIAGAGSRLAAGVLDVLLLTSSYWAVASIVALIAQIDPSGVSGFVYGLLIGGFLLWMILYHVGFHLALGGRTPGKIALGLRVSGADGYPAGALAIVLRGLIWVFDVFLIFPLPLGVVLISSTSKSQRLGDLVGGTLVVRDLPPTAVREPWPGETWSGLDTTTLPLLPGMAARLSPEDLDYLRTLLTRRGMQRRQQRALFVDSARHYAALLDLGPFQDARVFLRELYLFARESLRGRDERSG